MGLGMAALGAGDKGLGAESKEAMPTVKLGSHTVSRLILGSNPILGYSHVSGLMSRLMTDYFTLERIQHLLLRCRQLGINTWQTSASDKVDKSLATLRGDGADMQWVFLASGRHLEDVELLKATIAQNKPIAIVHHGGVSDRLWREGKIEKAHDFAKRVQDLGVLAGISAHNPDVIRNAEDKGWNLDLYMACFYEVTRTGDQVRKLLGDVPLGELFLPGDPARMCEVVRAVKRPCLGFKILAASRRAERPEHVASAFEFAFEHIKPTDAVIVGMFPRFTDQAGENAALTRRFGTPARIPHQGGA